MDRLTDTPILVDHGQESMRDLRATDTAAATVVFRNLENELIKQIEKADFVGTGSFNLTETATYSFENAIVLSSEVIARAYFDEWAQILAISEPLDWTSDWIEPEWRVGT